MFVPKRRKRADGGPRSSKSDATGPDLLEPAGLNVKTPAENQKQNRNKIKFIVTAYKSLKRQTLCTLTAECDEQSC